MSDTKNHKEEAEQIFKGVEQTIIWDYYNAKKKKGPWIVGKEKEAGIQGGIIAFLDNTRGLKKFDNLEPTSIYLPNLPQALDFFFGHDKVWVVSDQKFVGRAAINATESLEKKTGFDLDNIEQRFLGESKNGMGTSTALAAALYYNTYTIKKSSSPYGTNKDVQKKVKNPLGKEETVRYTQVGAGSATLFGPRGIEKKVFLSNEKNNIDDTMFIDADKRVYMVEQHFRYNDLKATVELVDEKIVDPKNFILKAREDKDNSAKWMAPLKYIADGARRIARFVYQPI